MQRNTAVGERIVSVTVPGQDVGAIVRAAGEHYDGSGYPDGSVGTNIPTEARIVAVCAALEAMIARREYRPARSLTDALAQLQAGSGTQFDPAVVDVLVDMLEPAAAAAG